MQNMSRKDAAGLAGQGMGETPRTGRLIQKWEQMPGTASTQSFVEDEVFEEMNRIERELNQAIKERDKFKSALAHLIKLHERRLRQASR